MEAGISSYLAATTTPELYGLYVDIDKLLEWFNIRDHDDEILELIMTDQTRANGETPALIFSIYENMLDYLLSEHGVTLVEDVSLFDQFKVCNGLRYIAQYENKEQVKALVETARSPEEALGDLFELVTDLDSVNLCAKLDSFNPALLNKIIDALPDDIEDPSDDLNGMLRLTLIGNRENLKIFFADDTLLLNKAMEAGMTVGYSADVYLTLIMSPANLKTMPAERVANNLLYAALISKDHYKDHAMFLRDFVAKNIIDTEFVVKVQIALSQVMMKYDTFLKTKDNP